MPFPRIQRAVYSSNWGDQGLPGGIAYHDNIPSDAYYLPPIPEGSGDSMARMYPSGALKWSWSHARQQWIECPDYPADIWAWDWSFRYDLDFSDDLNPVYVLKPDAQPVEPPAE